MVYFLVYVDDLIITSNDDSLISQLDSTFSTKDLGPLSFFCGVKVCRNSIGLFLNQ